MELIAVKRGRTPEQETQCIIDLHTISTKNHARPTISLCLSARKQLALPARKAALAREADEVGIDCPQIEAPFGCHGRSGLNCRAVACHVFVLGSGRPAKRLEQ